MRLTKKPTLLKRLDFKGLYLARLQEFSNSFCMICIIFQHHSRFLAKDSFLKALLGILTVYFESHFLKRPRKKKLKTIFLQLAKYSMVFHQICSVFRGNFLWYFLDFNQPATVNREAKNRLMLSSCNWHLAFGHNQRKAGECQLML